MSIVIPDYHSSDATEDEEVTLETVNAKVDEILQIMRDLKGFAEMGQKFMEEGGIASLLGGSGSPMGLIMNSFMRRK